MLSLVLLHSLPHLNHFYNARRRWEDASCLHTSPVDPLLHVQLGHYAIQLAVWTAFVSFPHHVSSLCFAYCYPPAILGQIKSSRPLSPGTQRRRAKQAVIPPMGHGEPLPAGIQPHL